LYQKSILGESVANPNQIDQNGVQFAPKINFRAFTDHCNYRLYFVAFPLV